MCWNIQKTKNINSKYLLINNVILQVLYFKKIKTISSAVSYKNRFLIYKRSSKFQFVGLFINKGLKLQILKLVNKIYLNFLYKFHNLNFDNYYLNNFEKINLSYGEYINLYNAFSLFKNWDRALIWRVEENLPLIKVISKKQQNKKKKKSKKKKKYILEFKYIKKKSRFQIALKWLSLLIKTTSNKIINGFVSVFLPFLINPNQSKYIILKKKIYSNILTTL